MPTVRDFDNPAFCILLRVTLKSACLLPTAFKMSNVAMRLNDRQRGCADVVGISTQMIVPSDRQTGFVYDNGVEYS